MPNVSSCRAWRANGNYSYNVTAEELFDLFGKFGPVRYVMAKAPRTVQHLLY